MRLSTEPVLNPGGTLDVAIALNWEDFLKFGGELPVGGNTIVIYESKTGVAPDKLPPTGVTPAEVFAAPISEMARETLALVKAQGLAQDCGRELHTGVFFRDPKPPATFDALVKARQAELAMGARSREKILDLFVQR